jgi:hypothetical protein
MRAVAVVLVLAALAAAAAIAFSCSVTVESGMEGHYHAGDETSATPEASPARSELCE